MKLLILSLSVVSSCAWAAVGENHTFMCKVGSFDAKEAVLNCDPSKPDVQMKTPRDWISADQEMKFGNTIKLVIDDKHLDKWLAMNKTAGKKQKEKAK